MLPSGYPLIPVALLVIFAYAGYEDFRKRKITTFIFLILDSGLLIYYIFVDYWIALFLVPVISEFFLKKFSLITYLVLVIPPVFNLSPLTISLSYSILIVKLFGTLVKNFGRGDVKALQSLAIAMPLYPHLPTIDSLFPPVMAVALIASIIGTVGSIFFSREQSDKTPKKHEAWKSVSEESENVRFWTEGTKRVYKIPFVTYVAVGYTFLFFLSLLRLD